MALQWKFTGNQPVYMQIMDQIRNAVLMGEYPPGSRIPPVREFAALAQVNPNTMQRAMVELEREGLLVSCGTTGRFVTSDPQVVECLRQQVVAATVRACAAQFRALGVSMTQAAQLLMETEKEENHGSCIMRDGTD